MISSMTCVTIDYLSFLMFMAIYGTSPTMITLANLSARAISATINYNINCKVVFKKGRSKKSALQFFVLATGVISVNSLILYVFNSIFGIVPALAKILVDILLFFVNYTVQHKYIFKDR